VKSAPVPMKPIQLDHDSLLVSAEAGATLSDLETALGAHGLTLEVEGAAASSRTVGDWIASGARGARDVLLDPADHLVAGFEARLPDGSALVVKPSPRRAVGPDLFALFLGTGDRFARLERAWIRVHRRDVTRPRAAEVVVERDPPLEVGEERLLAEIGRALA